MKVSKLALVLALAAGVGMTSPTLAQKNKKEAAGAGAFKPELSKGFRDAAQPVQKALQAKDFATAKAGLAALEPAATGPDEKYYVGQWKIAIGQGTNDQALVMAGLADAYNSGSAGAAADKPKFAWYLGRSAYLDKKDYATAIRYLDEAKAAGYVPTDNAGQPTRDLDLVLFESYAGMKQYPQAFAAAERAIAAEKAAGKQPSREWLTRPTSIAYQAKMYPEAVKWSRMLVETYPTPDNWRSALEIYDIAYKPDDQARLDLMRLQRAAGALSGERDYFDYALLADKVGLPGEAKAVLDEGKAKNAYNASSQAITELTGAVSPKVAADRASLAASEKSANAAANGRAALATGDAFYGYGDYAKAAAMYRLAVQKGGIDANTANLRLGMALARSGQAAEAKQAFASVTQGPRAEIARFWTLHLDQGAKAS
jgi:hypothetical protein